MTSPSSQKVNIDNKSTPGDERALKNAFACTGPWQVEDLLEVYDQWSPVYDEDFNDDRYKGPRFSAEAISKLFPEVNGRKDAKVLDVAAGTGRVGKFLTQMGFSEIHALDPSSSMLAVLKQRGHYKHIYQDIVGHHQTDVPDAFYDVTNMSGGFVEGHVPVSALDEMLRVTKKGGHVVVSMREEYLDLVPDYRQLEPHAASLEEQGRWKLVSREIRPNYLFGKYTGVVFVWQVL